MSAIRAAFLDGPPPALDPSSAWPEIADAASQIGSFTWQTAPVHVLDAVHDALPWLGAESFVYWLPGLLIDLVIDPPRSDLRGYSLVLALTPPRNSDLEISLREFSESRRRFDERTYASVVETLTKYYTHVRRPLFEDRWGRLTPAQHAAVLQALAYLAREHARDDANEAVARWQNAAAQ